MMMEKRKVKLTIAYDGTRFHGWAAPAGVLTIQGAISGGV